jgi:hypothetical protein
LFKVLCGSRKAALRSGFDTLNQDVGSRRRGSLKLKGPPQSSLGADAFVRSFVPPDDAQTLETPKHTFIWGPNFLHLVALSKETQ